MTATSIALCQCGCGKPAPIASKTDAKRGWRRGEPIRFVHGHHARAESNWNWRGGSYINDDSYRMVRAKDNPRADHNGYVREHILIVERALGKALRPGAVVHHFNRSRADNSPGNLVACHDQNYHMLLEQRQDALEACGHSGWLRCGFCSQWDAPENLYVRPNGRSGFHRSCSREYQSTQRARRIPA